MTKSLLQETQDNILGEINDILGSSKLLPRERAEIVRELASAYASIKPYNNGVNYAFNIE